jgi:diguanylate cyclase (GGDEF)-like protein
VSLPLAGGQSVAADASVVRRALASPAIRVWLFTVALAGSAVVIYATLVHPTAAGQIGIDIPWWLIAIGFALAELKVIEVHFLREAHAFSLNEVPAVIGLASLSPEGYLLAVLVGSGIALMLGPRQNPLKLAFNVSNFAFVAVVALAIFHRLVGPGDLFGPNVWFATFAAMLSGTVLSSVTIATAIELSAGAPQFQKLPEMIQFGALVAAANTSLALLAVMMIQIQPLAIWLLAVPILAVFLAYRAYVSEREKHERLELLYQSSRILQGSPELDRTLIALLEHAREMFRAERAEIYLYPDGEEGETLFTSANVDGQTVAMAPVDEPDERVLRRRVVAEPRAFFHQPARGRLGLRPIRQAMVSPLRGESGLIGTMVVANRLTEGTAFEPEDLRLLETLANQAAVALANGQLEQSLAELSRLKDQLDFMAFHDALTGLSNRVRFLESVAASITEQSDDGVPVVLFIDLDDFKVVNDSFGHAAGDALLSSVAERIQHTIRSTDLAARLGGDEFAVLMHDTPDLAHSAGLAQRLIESLGAPFPIQGEELVVGASIGIACATDADERADGLLRNADVAMYTAKANGKRRFAVFEPAMHSAIIARHELSAELARAVVRGELSVHYQPIVDLSDGEVVGFEALARWNHPRRGPVPPDEFIALAEENSAIHALGRWVMHEACRQLERWKRQSGRPLAMSVNLSLLQLQQPGFIDEVDEVLELTGVAPADLIFEVTESVMFRDAQTTIARLEALRDRGARIALDDFGTGYSSLGYLRRFPVDILKMAREFVSPSEPDPEPWAFAGAIAALGRTLGLKLIAEGIEAPEQRDRLLEMGCDYGQGFAFAYPMPPEQVDRLLAYGAPVLVASEL